MCTGMEIAGLVTALAGTGASITASEEEKSAMNAAANAELQRQQQYQKRGSAAFQESLGQSTPAVARGQIDQGAQQALQEYQKLAASPMSSAVGTNVAPQGNQVVETARNQGYEALLGQKNAANQGYGNMTLEQYLKDLNAKAQLGTIAGEAQASNRVLPLELQQAGQSWSELQGIGSLLQSAGGLMGLYGAINPMNVGGASATPGVLTRPLAGTQAFRSRPKMFGAGF